MQWDRVSPEFAEACVAAEGAPPGPDRVRAHEATLRLAHEHASFAEEFVARVRLADALTLVADTPDLLAHVAWLRAALAPEHGLEAGERDEVLWRLRWAVEGAERMPEVPLEHWRTVVEDLEDAYRADGYALRPVHAARARLAAALDDPGTVDRELARWLAEPRDDRSDCPACESREQAVLVAPSDPRRALDLLAPVLAGELTCADEPQLSLSLDAELRAGVGDLDRAATSFRRAWPVLADDPSHAVEVARCLRVLVRMGNTDRAVDLLLPRLSWVGDLTTAVDRMWFAGTAAWVLHHGRRLGLAPDTVDGRPVVELQDALATAALDLADRFDVRAGTTVTASRLGAACDDGLVSADPTLPPTRLSAAPAAPVALEPTAPTPTSGAEVVALAARVLQARRDVEPGLDTALRGWFAGRDAVLGRLSSPEEWAAASALDRAGAFLLRDLDAERERLTAARDEARRGADPEGAAHAEADLATLDVRTALAASGGVESHEVADARRHLHDLAGRLERAGRAETAAAVWRWYALTTRPADGVHLLRRAADLYGSRGLAARRALSLLDAAPMASVDGPAPVEALVEEALGTVGDHAVIRAQALDLRARLARSAGDLDAAVRLHEQSLDAAGKADGTRIQALFAFCDLLVDLADWRRLEPRAADALALAVRMRDRVALAVAQRHLGLAWVETGRPAEALELLEAALPVIEREVPMLVGPTGWALGNAAASLGSWASARAAFESAAAGFVAAGRSREASHARYRAGTAAWDSGDTGAAAALLDDALDSARASGTVEVVLAALRSRAALRAATEDLDAGLADLDAALAETERFAAGLPTGATPGEEFDPEVLEPDVLRQGAHLLATAGRPDDAVARLARAEALVGGGFEVVLRAEAGIVLAEAGRLPEAEPRLRASLGELRAGGLTHERIGAAQALARALDRDGRTEEADEVWSEFGPQA